MTNEPASPKRRLPRLLSVAAVAVGAVAVSTTAYAIAAPKPVPGPVQSAGCAGGLLSNWSFESAMTGWTTMAGTFASASASRDYGIIPWDGTEVMYLRPATTNGEVRQDVPGTAGGAYQLTMAGGTHNPSFHHEAALVFLDAAGTRLDEYKVELDHDVDLKGDLQFYDLGSHVAPKGTVTVRVALRNADGDWAKADAVCLTGPATVATTSTTSTPSTTVRPATTTTRPAPTTTVRPTTTTTSDIPNPPT